MHWQVVPVLTAAIPVAWAWWFQRRTALVHAMTWGILAWAAWVVEAALQTAPSRYVAVALTACTGVAVLGARRPGAGAWNAVVAGLLMVFMVPIGRQFFLVNQPHIDEVWLWFLGIVTGIVCINYVPTALRWPTALTLVVCLMQIGYVNREPMPKDEGLVEVIGALVPWIAWLSMFHFRRAPADPTRIWLGFRDRFGAVWATRVLLQFNAAAKNTGLNAELRLDGFHSRSDRSISEVEEEEARVLLISLTQRFGWP